MSGQKKVPMNELRNVLSTLGLHNFQTYIQSGNVIFQSENSNKIFLQNTIQSAIKNHFGFEVPAVVKTRVDLLDIVDSCPFDNDKKENSYFVVLHRSPKEDLKEAVSEIQLKNETFLVTNTCVYLYCSNGYGNAKGNNNFFEKHLKVTATTRNYKTMLKLLSLSAD